MVWKCPPLNLFNWNHFWKWNQDMDAQQDYLANKVKYLEDEIKELELEIHLMLCKNANLRAENDRLMQQLASGTTGGH